MFNSLFLAVIAYTAWGFFPLYWKLLQDLPSLEILAHRLIWSCVFYFLILLFISRKNLSDIWRILKTEGLWIFTAGILISINWFSYIHAVNTGHVIQGSLAYFLTPLLNIAFGFFIFKEQLSRLAKLAIAMAMAGVCFLIFLTGEIPHLALIMALTFSGYGLCKKKLKSPALTTSLLESLVTLPAALFVAMSLRIEGSQELSTQHWIFLIGGGLVTALPLLWFSMAAQKIAMSTMGFLQFISPTLQFLLAVLLYHENFQSAQRLGFGMIWLGVAIYLFDLAKNRGKKIA